MILRRGRAETNNLCCMILFEVFEEIIRINVQTVLVVIREEVNFRPQGHLYWLPSHGGSSCVFTLLAVTPGDFSLASEETI